MRAMRLALALALATSSTSALANDNELSIGTAARSLRSSSANAITDDNLIGGELTYARGLPITVPGTIGLQAIAGLNWNSVSGQMFQTMGTDLSSTGLTLGLRARYSLHRLAVLNARADLGMTHTTLDLDASGRTLSDARWHALARGSLGADLYIVNNSRVNLGARFELGYVLATEAGLAPREDDGDSDMIMLPETQSSIGALDLGGRYISASLVVGF